MTSAAYKDIDGNIEWRNETGQFHRENAPAVEHTNGSKHWFVDGLRHRENGPAMEWADGSKSWYLNGQLHREDGPALKDADGTKTWYINGQIHRENGPATEYANGEVVYWMNDITGAEIEQRVKENIARIQAQKDQQDLFNELSQDQDISVKINTSSQKIHKKL